MQTRPASSVLFVYQRNVEQRGGGIEHSAHGVVLRAVWAQGFGRAVGRVHGCRHGMRPEIQDVGVPLSRRLC